LWGKTTDDKYLVLREYYYGLDGMNLQKTDSEFSHDLEVFLLEHQEIHNLTNLKMIPIYVDPSAASFIQQLSRDKFRYVLKANNKVIDGIRAVGSAFSQRVVYIHKSCINLLEEIVTYSWDEKAQKRGEDKPVKNKDHACDSLRYGYYSRKVPRKQSKMLVGGKK
jgi:phage terminase large subunit